MSDGPYLSLVIPAYNEQENIPTLLGCVDAALAGLGRPFEVVIVDDGSVDSTPALLAEGRKKYPWLRVLRMRRNSGQSAAFAAGFAAARGQLIATIDADLQNDPVEIPRLAAMLEEKQVDMVTGWRAHRQDSAFRRWQTRHSQLDQQRDDSRFGQQLEGLPRAGGERALHVQRGASVFSDAGENAGV